MMDDPLVREFEEVDEKLPFLAKIFVRREIDFRQLESDDPDPDVVRSIIAILRENLECFSIMTVEEVDSMLDLLNIACEVTCLVNEGICEELSPGQYALTETGKNYYAAINDSEFESEEDCSCSDF